MIDKSITLHIKDGDTVLSLDTSNPLRFEKEVVYVGNFKKWRSDGTLEYEFDVDEKDIDNWIEQHELQLAAGLEVVMPEEHNTAPSARRATALKLSKRLDSKNRLGLFVLGEFKDEDSKKALIKSQVSLLCPPQFKHGNTTFRRPIRHIAFTDNPVIGGLDPLTTIAASYAQEKTVSRKLAEKYGLQIAADATDEQIEAALDAHISSLAAAVKPAQTDPTITASATPTPDIGLHRDNRMMKIDALVAARKATPAEATKLKERWAGKELNLSTEGQTAFSDIIASYNDREPIREVSGNGRTGNQTSNFDPSKSVLSSVVARMNKARQHS